MQMLSVYSMNGCAVYCVHVFSVCDGKCVYVLVYAHVVHIDV